jgi:hypothetical protein
MTGTDTRSRKPETTAPATPEAPAPKAAPKVTPCSCGCGETTRRPEAKYVSGHDARHAGEVGRSDASDDKVREIFKDQPKLAAKALGVRATAARKVAEKAAAAKAREAAKAAAKIAYDEALAAEQGRHLGGWRPNPVPSANSTRRNAMPEEKIHLLISEGENVVVIGAHRLMSDALADRERYIDEVWGSSPDAYEISNRYGDTPATAVDITVGGEVAETLTVQVV